jgi:hypothetical protein
VNFNSEIDDSGPHLSAHLALTRPRAPPSVPPPSPTAPASLPCRAAHEHLAPHVTALTAAVPTAAVRAASLGLQPAAPLPPSRRTRPSPSCRAAVSAPVSRRLPVVSVRQRRAVARRRAAPPRAVRCARAHAVRHAPRAPPDRGRAGPAPRTRAARAATGQGRGPRGHGTRQGCARGPCPCGHGPRPALCVWAEREFSPVAPG